MEIITPTNPPNNVIQEKSYANVTSNISFPKKDQAIILESIEGIALREYIMALSSLVNSNKIKFISRISNARVCIYLDSKDSVDTILDKEIKLNGKSLKISPYISRNKRIVLSNVCPIIPHHIIEEKLHELKVTPMSPVTFMKVGMTEPGYSHILSFRRQLFVTPEDIKLLPDSFQINYEDTNYWIYVTSDALKCFTCNNMGHLAKNCPKNTIIMEHSQENNSQKIDEQTLNPKPTKETFTPNTNFQIPKDFVPTLRDKGIKRYHSITTSESSMSNKPVIESKCNNSNEILEYDTDNSSCSHFSQESLEAEISCNIINKKKKKAKTEDKRSDKEVWTDIRNELKEQILSPLDIDQFADDVKTLLGRSKARAKASYNDGAMVDVSRALELEPENITAKEIRAHTEYGRGNFEQAWILALRGEVVRTFPHSFRECSRTAEETVRECTGKSASKMLSSGINILKQYDRAGSSNAEMKSTRRLPRFLQEKVPQNIRTADTQRTNRISRLMANLYFGRMAHDKYFLETLHKDERLNSANKKGSKELQEVSEKALTDMETQQVILRERFPLYAALATGEAARARLSGARKEGLYRAQQQHAADAKRLIKSVREIYEQQNTQKCLENAQFAMEQISRKPLRFLPRKDKYLQELYDIIAMAFLDQKRILDSISESVREKRALVLLGLTVSREPSKDNILRVRPVATRDPKSRERALLRFLEISVRSSERCYLLHELSRLLLEMKQGLRARYFAVKCQNESRKASLRLWYLNATFLLARCHVLQNNRPDARATLLEGATIAKTYGQQDVSSFFETCAHVVVEGDTEYEEAPIEKREKALVELMADDELKSQAKHLFRRMSVVPVARRFSIMPGTRADDMSPASGAGRRASIMPRTEEPPKIQKSKLKLPLGFQDFDI